MYMINCGLWVNSSALICTDAKKPKVLHILRYISKGCGELNCNDICEELYLDKMPMRLC